jgi:hypothetical protein
MLISSFEAKTQAALDACLAEIFDAFLTGDGFLRTLASAGVCASALTPDRQAAAVPHAAVAGDVAQTRNVLSYLPSKLTLDDVVFVQ